MLDLQRAECCVMLFLGVLYEVKEEHLCGHHVRLNVHPTLTYYQRLSCSSDVYELSA
jgi:hypothetical protein